MIKQYTSLGLMSGTSGDGVDASIIESDGESKYKVILDKYFKYDINIYKNIHKLKDSLNNKNDLIHRSKEIKELERKITLFHAKVVKELGYKNIDIIGFHGQTIFHDSDKKISLQLGDAKILSQLTKKKVVYNFRENDIKNGGQGAPLTPIFHKLLVSQKKIRLPITILNLGGIANITSIDINNKMFSCDIGPGNCLIDKWIRENSDKNFDDEGKIAQSGTINKIILDQSLDNFYNSQVSKKKSFDTKDFDLSFVRGLTLEDGLATLTEFTAQIFFEKKFHKNIYACGGGRKNKFLLKSIEKVINCKIKLIDELNVDGDFIESQAFAYIAIRSNLGLNISFPETTGIKQPCSGGDIIDIR